MFLVQAQQAPVTQHLAIAGGKAQWLQATAHAAQGVQLLEATLVPWEDRSLEAQLVLTLADGLLGNAPT
ncbi:hypothetical protein D3C78_1804360 [compost metagenome]